MAQLREIHGSAAYPVQMHHIGFFHLGRVKSHAQHVQGERQVFSSFRQQNVKSMGQMASQGVRSPSGGCPVDFQAVNFFAPPEQQGGFQAGNMPVQSVAQPVRGGAGRDAMGDLKYCSALRRSHIGKYEDWESGKASPFGTTGLHDVSKRGNLTHHELFSRPIPQLHPENSFTLRLSFPECNDGYLDKLFSFDQECFAFMKANIPPFQNSAPALSSADILPPLFTVMLSPESGFPPFIPE